MTKFKKLNDSSSFTEQRLYLAISRWVKTNEETRPKYIKLDEGGREGTKDVSATNQSTYNRVSEARESKMPGGSSVSSLKSRSLKATRDEIDQIVRVGSISRPIAHHYQSFDLSSLN